MIHKPQSEFSAFALPKPQNMKSCQELAAWLEDSAERALPGSWRGGATGRKQTNKWSRQQIHWFFIKFLCDASINFCLKIGCDFSETRNHIARSRFPSVSI